MRSSMLRPRFSKKKLVERCVLMREHMESYLPRVSFKFHIEYPRSTPTLPSPTSTTPHLVNQLPPIPTLSIYATLAFVLSLACISILIFRLSSVTHRKPRVVGTLIAASSIIFGYYIRSYDVLDTLSILIQHATPIIYEYMDTSISVWNAAVVQYPYLRWLPFGFRCIDTGTRVYGVYLHLVVLLTYLIYGKSSTSVDKAQRCEVVKLNASVQATPKGTSALRAIEPTIHAEAGEAVAKSVHPDVAVPEPQADATDANTQRQNAGTIRPPRANDGYANATQAKGTELENDIVEFPPMKRSEYPPQAPKLRPREIPAQADMRSNALAQVEPYSLEDVEMASPSFSIPSIMTKGTFLPERSPPAVPYNAQPSLEKPSIFHFGHIQQQQAPILNAVVPSAPPGLPPPDRQSIQRRNVKEAYPIKPSHPKLGYPAHTPYERQNNLRNVGKGETPSRAPGYENVQQYRQTPGRKFGLNGTSEDDALAHVTDGIPPESTGILQQPFVFPTQPSEQLREDGTTKAKMNNGQKPSQISTISAIDPPVAVQPSLGVFGSQQPFHFQATGKAMIENQRQPALQAEPAHSLDGGSNTDDSGFEEQSRESPESSSSSFCFAGGLELTVAEQDSFDASKVKVHAPQAHDVNVQSDTFNNQRSHAKLPHQKDFTFNYAVTSNITWKLPRKKCNLVKKKVFNAIPPEGPLDSKHEAIKHIFKGHYTDVFQVDLTKMFSKAQPSGISACVVKRFHKSMHDNGVRECNIYKALNGLNQGHSHRIPMFYGEQVVGGIVKFAMQQLSDDLHIVSRALFENHLMVDPDDLKSITKQLVDAVKFMHDSGYIHCDIKPENIALECASYVPVNGKIAKFKSPKPYLIDMNAACLIIHANSTTMPLLGTDVYLSPEILTKHPWQCPRDAWALGLTLYEFSYNTGFYPHDLYLDYARQSHIELIEAIFGPVPHPMASTKKLDSEEFSSNISMYTEFHREILQQKTDLNDLLLRLLAVDAKKRMTMTEALKHAYLAGVKMDN
ncbi:hypothetical protein QCA50_010584 [Cerrena zonata]|uniref:Protein kinase domain-containing protein n=1 Tax=Cerrena zonata TaxID=2478898 RepID=A0AAW0G5E9_9APHY